MLKNKHIVFDRDGTCIVYKPYLYNPKDVKLMLGIKELIRNLLKFNNKLYLHTNQSGVSRGYFTIESVISCNEKLIDLLGFGKDVFRETCIATELNSSENSYRKPSPKFGLEILKKSNTRRSNLYYIGDNISDLETANNLGCKAFGIQNTKLKKSVNDNIFNYPVFESILQLNSYLYGR